MIKVGNDFFISIFIDNNELPLDKLGFVGFQAHSNLSFFQPMAQISISDNYKYFDTNPIGDNVAIRVAVGKSDNISSAFTYNFRLFKRDFEKKSNNLKLYTLKMTYNSPRYFNENSDTFYEGTSKQVLQKVATESGFTSVDLDDSADSMCWLPMGMKRCFFAKNVTKYAYLDKGSCYALGVSLAGQLRFKNISKINLSTSNNVFAKGGSTQKGVVTVLSDKEIMKAGFNNNMTGYKYETLKQDTDKTESLTSVPVPVSSNTILVNKKLNQNLSGSRIHVTPIGSSNTHANYQLALHQNTRIKNTFSLTIRIVTNQVTTVDLLDTINYSSYENSNGTYTLDKLMSGTYLVTAKTIFVTKEGFYFEKFEMVRQGYGANSPSNSQITT